MQAAYTARVRKAATRWIIGFTRSIFRELMIERHIECFLQWVENFKDWQLREQKRNLSLHLLRVLHHFFIGIERTSAVLRRLLLQWHHNEAQDAMRRLHAMQDERGGLQKAISKLKEECERLREEADEAKRRVAEPVVKEVVKSVPVPTLEEPAQADMPPRDTNTPPLVAVCLL